MVSRNYAKEVTEKGHEVTCNYEVASFDDVGGDYPISVKSAVSLPGFLFGFLVIFLKSGDEIRAKYVVTCAGLHADRVAKKSGGEEIPKIVPFRGDYLLMAPDKAKWINGNYF